MGLPEISSDLRRSLFVMRCNSSTSLRKLNETFSDRNENNCSMPSRLRRKL